MAKDTQGNDEGHQRNAQANKLQHSGILRHLKFQLSLRIIQLVQQFSHFRTDAHRVVGPANGTAGGVAQWVALPLPPETAFSEGELWSREREQKESLMSIYSAIIFSGRPQCGQLINFILLWRTRKSHQMPPELPSYYCGWHHGKCVERDTNLKCSKLHLCKSCGRKQNADILQSSGQLQHHSLHGRMSPCGDFAFVWSLFLHLAQQKG